MDLGKKISFKNNVFARHVLNAIDNAKAHWLSWASLEKTDCRREK